MYTALVCDDEKFQREGLARHVRWTEHGFDAPILCASAWEALHAMQTQAVDLLLTDVCMPGKDGLELIAECRRLRPDLYIVMISSFAEFEYARKAMQNGAREYLLKPIKPEDVHHMLDAFVGWKAARDTTNVSVDQNAAAVMQLLEQHVVDGITIAELAESIHMNPSYLCTLFKKSYGITISDKLNELQRERACQLLATSDLPMGEIAYQTGNRSASNFAQWFRKAVGMTPGEYRRLVRGRHDNEPGGSSTVNREPNC